MSAATSQPENPAAAAFAALKAADDAARAFCCKNGTAWVSFQCVTFCAYGDFSQSTKAGREAAADVLVRAYKNAKDAASEAWYAAGEAVDCSERLFPDAARLASVPERPPSDDDRDDFFGRRCV
jgi:hypothetical protein